MKFPELDQQLIFYFFSPKVMSDDKREGVTYNVHLVHGVFDDDFDQLMWIVDPFSPRCLARSQFFGLSF